MARILHKLPIPQRDTVAFVGNDPRPLLTAAIPAA
jgi:hypothetical protein